jgi:hypothetical protein
MGILMRAFLLAEANPVSMAALSRVNSFCDFSIMAYAAMS